MPKNVPMRTYSPALTQKDGNHGVRGVCDAGWPAGAGFRIDHIHTLDGDDLHTSVFRSIALLATKLNHFFCGLTSMSLNQSWKMWTLEEGAARSSQRAGHKGRRNQLNQRSEQSVWRINDQKLVANPPKQIPHQRRAISCPAGMFFLSQWRRYTDRELQVPLFCGWLEDV